MASNNSPRKVASTSDVERLAKEAEKMMNANTKRRDSESSHKTQQQQQQQAGVKPSRSQSIDDIISRDSSYRNQQPKSGGSGSSRQVVDKIVEDCEREAGVHYDMDEKGTCDWIIDEDYLKAVDKELKPEDKQHRRETAEKMKIEGNDLFKRSLYTEAARSYTAAIRTCPLSFGNERAILYANRAACFLYMNEAEEGIMDCNKSLEINPNYLKALMRRALLYEKHEKLEEALTDYKKVLELEPKNEKAIEACTRLPEEIKERNEKLKTEMLGKLKDLGNMILRPFGLSTDNFKMQQDPSTGSYSINMNQNK